MSLLFVALLVCVAHALGDSFNFEIARRTEDTLAGFFAPTLPLVEQIADGFNTGFFGHTNNTNTDRLRRFFNSQVLSTTNLRATGAVFGGLFVSSANTFVLTSESVINGSCTVPVTHPDEYCLHFATLDLHAISVSAMSSMTTTPERLGICMQDTPTWCPVAWFGDTLGLTFSSPITSRKNVTIGHSFGIIDLTTLANFLTETYGKYGDSRVVYIVEQDTHLLVAASIAGVSTTTSQTGDMQRVDATQCADSVIRESSVFLFQQDFIDDVLLFVHNGMYIQNTPYHDTGVNWHIIVVRPVEMIHDDIDPGSDMFIVLCLLSSLSIFVTLCLMGWVIRFRQLRLWKSAQPEVLLLILVSNLMCALCTFVLVGEPSDSLCLAQQWMVPLSITLTWTSFIAKLVRVLVASSTKDLLLKRARKVTARDVLVGICAVMVIQVLVLCAWTAFDRLKPTDVYETQLGVVVGHTHCKSNSNWGMYTCFGIVFILAVCGCVVAFRSRNLSGLLAESRSLMTTTFHGSIVLLILVLVGLFGNLAGKTFTALACVALDWFTASSQVALIIPRIYHQVTLGDLTTEQLKDVALHHLRVEANRRSMPSTPPEFMPKVIYGYHGSSSDILCSTTDQTSQYVI